MGKLDVGVFAASVDLGENAQVVQNDVSFDIGQGVGRDVAELLGAWWEDRRDFIQPSEFILGPDNKVLQSSYSSGPLARTVADDALGLIGFLDSRK